MPLAALDEDIALQGFGQGVIEALGAIDKGQQPLFIVQTASNEILDKLTADPFILTGGLDEAQGDFLSLYSDA